MNFAPVVERGTRLRHRLEAATLEARREAILSLPRPALLAFLHDWRGVWARDEQITPPGQWFTWLVMAGRGFGKTRTGAEWVNEEATGECAGGRIALVGATAADVRDTMVEGESGILACAKPGQLPKYLPSKRKVVWPKSCGSTEAFMFSADEPERLRGPQFHRWWADELVAWPDPKTWDMLMFGCRLPDKGRVRGVVTTTPKPASGLIATETGKKLREIIHDPGTIITKGRTIDNRANLDPKFLEQILRTYQGTRLGKQELEAEILDDIEGALYDMKHWREFRRPTEEIAFSRIGIGVDPAPTSGARSDETGIIAAGVGAHDGKGYTIADRSMRGSPDEWARAVVQAFYRFKADFVVAEMNCGGEMVETTIKTVDPGVPVKLVRAMRGKSKRAEPIAALMEQGRLLPAPAEGEDLEKLGKQMERFTGINGTRDDRVDAFNWLNHELFCAGTEFFVV